MELFINTAKPSDQLQLPSYRPQLMTAMSDEKESIHRDSLSVAKGPALDVDDQFAVRLPESLTNLTEAEREAVAKSGTRKVDIMLIPGRKRQR